MSDKDYYSSDLQNHAECVVTLTKTGPVYVVRTKRKCVFLLLECTSSGGTQKVGNFFFLFMRARACEYIKVCRGKKLWLRGDLECKKTASDYAFSSSSRVWKTGTLRKQQVVHAFVSSFFSSSLSKGERIICGNADVAFVERFIRVEPKGAREKLQNFHIRDWNVWDIVFISRIFRPYFSYVQ